MEAEKIMFTEIMLALLVLLNVALLVTVWLKDNRERQERKMLDEFARSRSEMQRTIATFSDSVSKRMNEISALQNTQFENIRNTVDVNLRLLRDDNNKKLETIRMTVDEKLHSTLEQRLGEAFKQVGDRLDKVHQGLGEMQKLATGVGDLKNILTNVKSRGTLGEIQLESQLMQLLSSHQYEKNVKTKEGSDAFVEFALKLPGKNSDDSGTWLPIDSKFPLEQYEILLDAYNNSDKESIERTSKRLTSDVKNFAKNIRDKYLDPPNTTDFALMYLPIEGLYAEVLRFSGLFEFLQREYRVVPVGPTTLAAILNSLQMGFRTLAIEKRSSEVWKLLGAVKTHFGKFGDLLDKTRKKLDEAGKSIEDATRKSRFIEGRLTRVQELPAGETGDFKMDDGIDLTGITDEGINNDE
jgi:DNA recombination protein RmuC